MPEDAGYGPPPGNPSGPARGGGTTFDELARRYTAGLDVGTKDPAFLRSIDATDANTQARAKLVYKDVPLVTIQNTWSIEEARGALYAHAIGQFYASGMLCDSILGDDRVTATLNARASGLFGRENRFKAANGSDAAKEVLRSWMDWWPRLTGDSSIRETQDYGTMMGFGHDQIAWDRTQKGLDFAPSLRPWHPVFEYYDWDARCYMAIGSEACVPIIPGNGKWLEYAPFGSYRGWIRGAIRPTVEPWMLRHFGFRDMARFGEVHGNPTRVGYVPIVGDPTLRQNFESALAGLGADAAMIVPRGIDDGDGSGYDYKLVEATSKAWEVHPTQIDRCDMAIVLAILMVNLTTTVEGGSYGATKAQMEKEKGGTQFDNRNWKSTIYRDLARPFAYLNYGDADLAPWTWWDVVPHEEKKDAADQFQKVGAAVEILRRGGVKFRDPDELRGWMADRFGLEGIPGFDFVEPVKEAPQKAGESGTTPPKPGGGEPGGPNQ